MSGDHKGRRNWTLSMTIALCAALAAAVIGSRADAPAGGVERLYLRNSGGAVLFDHGSHSENVDSCAVCHHDLLSGHQENGCVDCHGDDVDAADYTHQDMKQIHGYDCTSCHGEGGGDASSCRSCHATNQGGGDLVACSECHEDGYDTDLMSHDELLEIDDHSCLGCHLPDSLSSVYHLGCTPCHLEASPHFADPTGGAACGACHLQ